MSAEHLLDLGACVWPRSGLPAAPPSINKNARENGHRAEANSAMEDFLVTPELKYARIFHLKELKCVLANHGVRVPWDRTTYFVPNAGLEAMVAAAEPHCRKFNDMVAAATVGWDERRNGPMKDAVAAWAASEHIKKDPFGFTDSTLFMEEAVAKVLKHIPDAATFQKKAHMRIVAARISPAPAMPGLTSLAGEGLEEWTEDLLDFALGPLANDLATTREIFMSNDRTSWVYGASRAHLLEARIKKAKAWDLDAELETVRTAEIATAYLRDTSKALSKPQHEDVRRKLSDLLLVPMLRISDVAAREKRLAALNGQ